jgi:hypothetical protein
LNKYYVNFILIKASELRHTGCLNSKLHRQYSVLSYCKLFWVPEKIGLRFLVSESCKSQVLPEEADLKLKLNVSIPSYSPI